MWPEDEFLEKYSHIAAHIMCEEGIYEPGPVDAGQILRDVHYRCKSENEWVEHHFDGDAMEAVRQAVRNRHTHDWDRYKLALASIELALAGAI